MLGDKPMLPLQLQLLLRRLQEEMQRQLEEQQLQPQSVTLGLGTTQGKELEKDRC